MKTRTHETSTAVHLAQEQYLRRLASVAAGTLFASIMLAGPAWGTPGADVVGEPLATGSLADPIRNKLKDADGGYDAGTAVAQISTVKYTVQPGGYFGWHKHGGPVWVVIAAGTLTLYEGTDGTCAGDPQPAGRAFLDAGDHVHNARNEGAVPVVAYATFLLAAGAQARVDAPAPSGNACAF
jgi:hypothetical protein